MINRDKAIESGKELGRLLFDEPVRWINALLFMFLIIYLFGVLSGALLMMVLVR